MENRRLAMLYAIIGLHLFINASCQIPPDNVTSIYGTEIGICSGTHSCQTDDRCGRSPEIAEECACDAVCEYYGDCCYDYWSACMSVVGPKTIMEPSRQLECKEDDGFGYFVIAFCKDDTSVDADTIEKCENPGFGDALLKIIVSDTEDSIYNNIYCALCNGISIHDVTAWEATFICDNDDVRIEFGAEPAGPVPGPPPQPFPLITTQKTATTETPVPNIHEHLADNSFCPFITFNPPPGKQETRRPCQPRAVSECNENYMNVSVIDACNTNYKAIVYDTGNVIYRNPHCALCNDIPFYLCDNVAVAAGRFGFTSLTVVVDFSDKSSISVSSEYGSYGNEGERCDPSEVFDPFTNRCLQLTCKDKYVLEGSNCVKPSLFSDCGTRALHVPKKIFCGCNVLQQSLKIEYEYKDYAQNSFNSADKLTQQLQFRDVIYEREEKTNLNMTYVNVLVEEINCQLAYDISELVTIGISNSTEDILNSVTLWQNCSTKPFQSGIHCDYDSLLLTIEEELEYETLTRTIDAGNSSIQLPENEYVIKLIHELGNESSVCSILSLLECDACPVVELDVAGFQSLDNRTMIYKSTGDMLQEDEYILSETSNKTILVCSFLEQNEAQKEGTDFFNYSGALLIISVVCTIISLVSLLITILLRAFIVELRTLSGKIILNVSISLFLALFLTLIQGNFVELTTACTSFAVMLHYLWLVCFFWMNSMAFELFQTFQITKASSRSSRSKRSQRNSFMKYFIYSWGFPAAYVIIIVAISLCECTSLDVTYGDEYVCWIRDGLASFYVFGIPLALILIPNLILFMATVRGLRKSMKSSAAVRNARSDHNNQTGEMIIYIRISTIMGLTWALGFLASFVDHVILWYIFTILNSLQGLFIFIAFNINHSMKKILIQRREAQTSTQPKTTETELQPLNKNHTSDEQSKI